MRRAGLAALLLALVLPAAAAGADTFVLVPDDVAATSAPTTTSTASFTVPSAVAANAPGQIAVEADFAQRPPWVEERSVDELRPLWENAGAAYGIPWQVLAAINKVESNFGDNMGPSSAGAVGWMQFMPDTWLRWGVDANGDGVADPWNAEDAIFAAARYLAASGGEGDISSAVYSYNHADWYVNEVLALAQVYAGGASVTSAGAAFEPTADVSAAEQRVAATRDALARAEAAAGKLGGAVEGASASLSRTTLLSDSLLAQKRLTLVGVRYDDARALVRQLRTELADAQAELDRARASSFVSPLQLVGSSPFDSGAAMPAAVNSFGGGAAQGPAAPALAFALAQLGTPYLWGGEGEGGFDCSGLVQSAYATAGVSLPRVAQQQFDAGPFVPSGTPLQAGDLVFFGSDPQHIEHVGMVSGPGLMIDAPYTGAVVRFDSYERSSFMGATRPGAAAAQLAGAPDEVTFTAATPGSPAAGEVLFTKNA
jgi:cell wall-associated NlpC family hydrolase